jgi:anti-anti-sigma factor
MSWCQSAAYPLLRHLHDRAADRRRRCSSLAAVAVAGPPAELVLAAADGIAGTTTVVISGELDLTVMPPLAEQLARVLAGNPQQLIFDMARVGFIDCASARLIAGTGHSLPDGRRPVIRSPSPAARRVLELTGLDTCCQVER